MRGSDPLGAWVERAEDAEIRPSTYMDGKRENGGPYVRWLYHKTIVMGRKLMARSLTCHHADLFHVAGLPQEQWPMNISKLHRHYKEANREFLRHLYVAAEGAMPIEEFDSLVRTRTTVQRSDGAEVWDVRPPKAITISHTTS